MLETSVYINYLVSFCYYISCVQYLPSYPPLPLCCCRFGHILLMLFLSMVLLDPLPPPITPYGWFSSMLLEVDAPAASSRRLISECWWWSLLEFPPPIAVMFVVVLVVCSELLDGFRCNNDFLPFLLFWSWIAIVSFLGCVEEEWWLGKFPLLAPDEFEDEFAWLSEPPWRRC